MEASAFQVLKMKIKQNKNSNNCSFKNKIINKKIKLNLKRINKKKIIKMMNKIEF